MEIEKTKILILEDDESVGAALKEVLSRAGYQVYLAGRPDEANTIIAENSKLDFFFCDCLLPQMTGLEYVQQVQKNYPNSTFKVVLMSGVYTDKDFIQEATRSTKAVAFLKKPFEMEQILKIVKKDAIKKEEMSSRKLLYQMFANPKLTARQKRKVIESIEEISGYDLPFLYSLLAETNSSGYLNIYGANGSVSGITFSNGNIVGADVDDKTTFLGEMLIQSGYALPQDVQTALRDKNNRKIGSYLIQNNQLSPHAFDLILMEQMNIRLVRTIVEDKFRINFAASEVEMSSPSIDVDSLSLFLHDWIASKISVNWLKSLYLMWTGNVIVKSASWRDDHPALQMSLIKALDDLALKLNNQMTMAQLLEVNGYNEIAIYKGIHFLLTKGLIVFAQRVSFSNPQEQAKILKKIWIDLEGKNSFEILSRLNISGEGASLQASLEEFCNYLGSEPSDKKSELYLLWSKIKKAAEDAVLSSRDVSKVDQYRQASQKTEAEGKLKALSLIEDAKKSLVLNQFSKASTILSEVSKLNAQAQYLHILFAWTKLGAFNTAQKSNVLKEVELDLLQVPPDEKYDALYPFVMGLYSKAKGDFVAARKNFEKAVAIDSTFMPPRREMSLLAVQSKKQDVFNMDLKQVVSGFFKKK